MKKSKNQFRVFGFILLSSLVFLLNVPVIQAAQPEIPTIIPRSEWLDRPDLVKLVEWLPEKGNIPPDYQTVERIVIHHTVHSAKQLSEFSPKTIIQNIFRYHTVTRGWGDIGYSYLIDQNGKIYEGRYGGNGVRGAHVYEEKLKDNFNLGTIGIGILGNFEEQKVSSKVRESLEKLTGWLAAVNNLNPSELNKTTRIWNSQTKSYSSTFKGPVILGHNDLEATICPGKYLWGIISSVRTKATSLARVYQEYLYQAKGSSLVYTIKNGQRKGYASLDIFLSQGSTYQRLVNISRSQIDAYVKKYFAAFVDGTLLRQKDSAAVYILERGKKRPFLASAQEFAKLGFNWDEIKEISSTDLNGYQEGLAIKYGSDGTLVQGTDPTVWLIEEGRKRKIASGELFVNLGFSWWKVKKSQEIENYLTGPIVTYPEDTLLRQKEEATVYLIKDNERRVFTSGALFNLLGYKWRDVLTISEKNDLLAIPLGGSLLYPDGILIKGSASAVYILEAGMKRPFTSGQLFGRLGYQWSKIVQASDDELKEYSLGQAMAYPDKTLVRGSGPGVYLLENGQKRIFSSAELFENLGYQWGNILEVDDKELALYSDGNQINYPTDTIVFQGPGSSVYLIKENEKREFPSAEIFESLGFQWKNLLLVSAGELARYALGLVMGTSEPEEEPSPEITQEPNVRIAIVSPTTEVMITANGPYSVYNKNGLVGTKSGGETTTIAVSSSTYTKFVPVDKKTILEIKSYTNWNWNKTKNYNQFRGNLEIKYSNKSQKVWVVNELPLEDYLKGVAEALQNDPTEHIRVMTVAARTYVVYYLQKDGKYGSDEVYHLTNTSSDQLYKGYGREVLAPAIIEAVTTTKGQIATYQGKPIVSAYSSGAPELITQGTRNACSVWNKYCVSGFEYLTGGVKDISGTNYTQTICGGANHCVGLSAAGSRYFSGQGLKNYQEILKYYYLGVKIEKIY
ncbi:MAG TPA: hypothetical protein ENI16_00765 [Candidatus Portnoybacteria bacterium]|nr:hypothetical protein [Candidatus Portnoybacteria bacterium]